MLNPDPKKRMKYAVNLNLLLIENGKLSPGGGSPSPPLLRVDVAKPRTGNKARADRDRVMPESENSLLSLNHHYMNLITNITSTPEF